mmetsp:Transcript_89735/g.278959  ORF Transcript_89735/g.278959 Transcript_89735/m.278959 type:complete len:265 (+) Transcript_89735:43-837(+)
MAAPWLWQLGPCSRPLRRAPCRSNRRAPTSQRHTRGTPQWQLDSKRGSPCPDSAARARPEEDCARQASSSLCLRPARRTTPRHLRQTAQAGCISSESPPGTAPCCCCHSTVACSCCCCLCQAPQELCTCCWHPPCHTRPPTVAGPSARSRTRSRCACRRTYRTAGTCRGAWASPLVSPRPNALAREAWSCPLCTPRSSGTWGTWGTTATWGTSARQSRAATLGRPAARCWGLDAGSHGAKSSGLPARRAGRRRRGACRSWRTAA